MKTFESGAVFICDDTRFEILEVTSMGIATVKCLNDSEIRTSWVKDKVICRFNFGKAAKNKCFLVDN